MAFGTREIENHTAQPQFRIEMLTTNTTAAHCGRPGNIDHQNDRGVQKFRDRAVEARSSSQLLPSNSPMTPSITAISHPGRPRKSLHELGVAQHPSIQISARRPAARS